jgi:hypothetical protein
MFGSNHYVPILRSKMAERLALRNLLPSDRKRITPLIELTPASFKARKRGRFVRHRTRFAFSTKRQKTFWKLVVIRLFSWISALSIVKYWRLEARPMRSNIWRRSCGTTGFSRCRSRGCREASNISRRYHELRETMAEACA